MVGETGFPPDVRMELDGWVLTWARLVPVRGFDVPAEAWGAMHEAVRRRVGGGTLVDEPEVSAVRRLFRAAGTDPSRYRPSSEALVRRVLKGGQLPRISPLVDLNNMLSLELLLPCCVVDIARLEPPFVLRSGRAGEQMESLRGSFALEGRPLLEDAEGPFGTPITDAERVKITTATEEAWLVVYGARDLDVDVLGALEDLLERDPVAELLAKA